MKIPLSILLLLIFSVVTYQLIDNEKPAQVSGQQAMQIAIDPTDGTFVRPSIEQRQALKIKQQSLASDSEKIQYRNTLTVYPDGTKSGVVDPQFLHTIYATKNADGEIVLHEGKESSPQQATLEVR